MSKTIVDELVVTLGAVADNSLEKNLTDFLTKIKNAVFTVQGISLAVGAAIAAGVSDTVSRLDEINDASERLGGASAENLQSVAYAAKLLGSSGEAAQHAMGILGRTLGDAIAGNETAQKSFMKLGVALKNPDGSARDLSEVFLEVRDRLSQIEDPALRASMAQDVLGRGALELGGVINATSEEFKGLTDEARESGYVVGNDVVKAGGKAGDAIDRLKMRFTAFVNKIFANKKTMRALELVINAIGRVVLFLGDAIGFLFDIMTKWYVIIPALIIGLSGLMASALASAGSIYVLIGATLGAIIEFGILAAEAIFAAGATAAAWIAATWPIWAIIAVLALLYLAFEDIQTYINGGDSVFGRLEAWANSIDPDDNPWLNAFKNLISFIQDLFQIIWGFAGDDPFLRMGERLDWVVEKLKVALEFWKKIPGVGGAIEAVSTAGKFWGNAFGGGATPEASAQVSSMPADATASYTSQQQNQSVAPVTNITVNASTNANPQEIAGAMSKVMDEKNKQMLSATMSKVKNNGND